MLRCPSQLALEGPCRAGERRGVCCFLQFAPTTFRHLAFPPSPSSQDCLWAGRCISRGWFLPYTPVEKEYGAWKSHYVSCFSTLDWLTPREDAERYGTLNRQSTETIEEGEEEEEMRKERRIRQMIRDKLRKEKGE